MINNFRWGFLCIGIAVLLTINAEAADKRKQDGNYATQRAFGEFDRNAGWCDNATTTSTNIWDSSNVPDEIKGTAAGKENRRAIRQIIVTHADGTNTTTPMCARLGPDTGTNPSRVSLTCVGTSGSEQTNGHILLGRFAAMEWISEEMAPTATPAVHVKSSTGTVRYCVTVFWKS